MQDDVARDMHHEYKRIQKITGDDKRLAENALLRAQVFALDKKRHAALAGVASLRAELQSAADEFCRLQGVVGEVDFDLLDERIERIERLLRGGDDE